MASPPPVPFFDGHNDVLLRLYRRGGTDAPQAFLEGETKGHLDLLKALQGGFAGGLFAVFVPSPGKAGRPTGDAPSPDAVVDAPTAPPIDLGTAQSVVFSMFSLLFRIERESQGRVRVCRSVSDIRRCMKDGVLAAVLHIEGAEAIDLNFELLDVLYAAGLRFGTEHVGMCKHPLATKHLAVVDRIEPDGTNPVKQLFAQREIIDIRRRRPARLYIDIAWVVHQIAQAGMCFQPAPIGQVHRARGNVIDRGVTVGLERTYIRRRICDVKPLFCGAGKRR